MKSGSSSLPQKRQGGFPSDIYFTNYVFPIANFKKMNKTLLFSYFFRYTDYKDFRQAVIYAIRRYFDERRNTEENRLV